PVFQTPFDEVQSLLDRSHGSGHTTRVIDPGDLYSLPLRHAAHCMFMGFTGAEDRKSTRLNSSHVSISYAVFCLKKKKKNRLVTNSTTMTILTELESKNKKTIKINERGRDAIVSRRARSLHNTKTDTSILIKQPN